MWYKPIACDNTVKIPLICDYSNFEKFGFFESDFRSGKEIDNWPESIVFQATQKRYDGEPDDVLQSGFMIPIFSQRLKDSLDNAGIRGIQYLPVIVKGERGNTFPGFYIANILHLVEAFDYVNSAYFMFPDDFPNPVKRGKLGGVMKYVLRSTEIGDYDIFRLTEYNLAYFVSGQMKELFLEKEFSGYSFVQVECLP
jgi:hypothetical protein